MLDQPLGKTTISPRSPDTAHHLTPEDLERIADTSRHELAEGTRIAYRKHYRYFSDWCEQRDLTPMPAEALTVKAYATDRARYLCVSTINTAAAAIQAQHIQHGYPSPLKDPQLRGFLQALSKQYPHTAQQVSGITRAEFAVIAETAYDRKPHETPFQAQRRASTDITLISLMRDTMLRRSEAAAARWQDLKMEPDGTGRLTIPKSKTDQTGKSTVVFVSKLTRTCLDIMLHYRQGNGPTEKETIFGISGRQICNRIKDAATFAELEGRFGGHSPRIGMAMDMAMDEVEMPSLMQAGRWQKPETLLRYIAGIAAGKGAVARYHQRHNDTIDIETF